MMEVTKVYMNFPKKKYNRLRAWAKIILDDVLIVTDICVMEKKNKDGSVHRYLIFPQKTLPARKGEDKDRVISITNPIKNEFRVYLTELIFEAYDAAPNKPAFD